MGTVFRKTQHVPIELTQNNEDDIFSETALLMYIIKNQGFFPATIFE